MLECSPERLDPEWLAHDEGVQGNPVDQRLSPGLALHLVEICNDHVGKSLGSAVMQGDHRNVVDLLRVRHAEEPALARANPDWLVVDRPVWIRTRKGRLLSVPYPQEVNDIPMIALVITALPRLLPT